MAALNPLFVPGGLSPRDARIALGGLLALQGPGPLDVRTGVLSGFDVTPTSDTAPMTFEVSAGVDVALRSASDGAEIGSNDGPEKVSVAAAPASNARVDLLWKRNTDTERDGSTAALFGVTEGQVSATPVGDYASVPAGAVVYYEARIGAGAVRTTDPQVTLTRVVKQTVARGGLLPIPSQAELDALAPYDGQPVVRTDLKVALFRSGSVWRPIGGYRVGADTFEAASGFFAVETSVATIAGRVFSGDVEASFSGLVSADTAGARALLRVRAGSVTGPVIAQGERTIPSTTEAEPLAFTGYGTATPGQTTFHLTVTRISVTGGVRVNPGAQWVVRDGA